MLNFKLIVILAAVAALADYVWLGTVMSGFYKNQLGDLLRPFGISFDIRLLGAVAVYLLLALGILYFVLPLASSASTAFISGALFGLVVYGIYDFTNWALLTRWPLPIIFADVVWGVVLIGFLSYLAHYATQILSS